jgi:hypothetical protein
MQPLEGRSKAIFIVTTIFLGISFIAVCLRCFVRLKLVKAFGWDDALMVFAMVNAYYRLEFVVGFSNIVLFRVLTFYLRFVELLAHCTE